MTTGITGPAFSCSDEFTVDIEIKPANTTAVDKRTAG